MTFNPFSALTAKIFGGLAIAALLWAVFVTIDRNQWRAAARASDATLAKVGPAQELALERARKAIADTEARYKEQANEADANHAAAVADARSDADRYIAAHRVPACPGRAPSGTTAPASGGSAGVPVSVPSGSIVGDADVHACSGAAAYAIAAHEWALGLGTSAVGVVSNVK